MSSIRSSVQPTDLADVRTTGTDEREEVVHRGVALVESLPIHFRQSVLDGIEVEPKY